ncbi:hypothetical protein Q8A73_006203 [Channa argus]|nr:hypothetical protein Q8A73_006203 [Channa argus]
MGSEISQEEYDSVAVEIYENPSWFPCFEPDVGIDDSLLKYSGLNSNSELRVFTNELVNTVPGFVNNLGARLAPLTSVPNAVGIVALLISFTMELLVKGTTQTSSFSMVRSVFGEEKASAVRDTMYEVLRRYKMFMNNEQTFHEELQTLERRLSHDLATLQNSLLHDGQMTTRRFKIWVNGAYFHVQMLIHEARLSSQTDQNSSQYVVRISNTIDLYLEELDNLLQEYKKYKIRTTKVFSSGGDNVNTLINQHDAFTLPSAA